MNNQSSKHCPLCQKEFTCKVNDIENCDCNKIILTEAAGKFLERSGLDCLCNECLEKVNAGTLFSTDIQ